MLLCAFAAYYPLSSSILSELHEMEVLWSECLHALPRLKIYIFYLLILEKGGEREEEWRETMMWETFIGCVSEAPQLGSKPLTQTWGLTRKLMATFHCARQCWRNWATLVRLLHPPNNLYAEIPMPNVITLGIGGFGRWFWEVIKLGRQNHYAWD